MQATLSSVMSALLPVFFGGALAFLANPLVNKVEAWLKKRGMKKGTRALAIVTAIITYGALLYVAVYLIVPSLAKTLIGLVNEFPGMIRRTVKWVEDMLRQNEQMYQIAEYIWTQVNEWFSGWLKQDLLSTLMSTLASVANGVYNVAAVVINAASVVFNLVIGLIVMVYLLASKDDFVGQSKKILYAACKNKKLAADVLDVARETNRIFNGFISGKLLDSLIIGILCFISVSILKMPYPLLVSVIVGVTNVIPVFGPFIGAVPCAFLILLVDPMKCLIFILFIFILQQVDGNIIGPMILGDSTGLSAFWVTFAILLFGKLMGFVGMIVGVPLFATFYYIVKKITEASLRKKELPTETAEYVHLDYIDEGNELHYLKEDGKRGNRRKEAREKRRKKAALLHMRGHGGEKAAPEEAVPEKTACEKTVSEVNGENEAGVQLAEKTNENALDEVREEIEGNIRQQEEVCENEQQSERQRSETESGRSECAGTDGAEPTEQ